MTYTDILKGTLSKKGLVSKSAIFFNKFIPK